ncbi:MAG: hypothetical protein FJW94_03510 [Actinobacteria bacterium]|nr:hypothetical protein [Actinomycetota bacterium]
MTPRPDDDDERRTAAPDPYRMPESEQLLRRVIEIVEAAPGLPMSASVRINKDELLELLDDAVASLPEEIRNARWLLKEREDFTARTKREAADIIEDARQRVAAMVDKTELARAAEARAREIVDDAEAESRRMRRETEDFCDQKLASFEIVLERIRQTVAKGRDRLAAPTIEEAELADFADQHDGALPGGPSDGDARVFDQDL